MMSAEDFASLARQLAKLNDLDVKIAGALLAQIGDTPELSEDGRVVIVWKGTEYQLAWPDDDLED